MSVYVCLTGFRQAVDRVVAGFTVQLYGKDGQNVVEAVNHETNETFVVRGEDLYEVVVELAQQCGIELEDG